MKGFWKDVFSVTIPIIIAVIIIGLLTMSISNTRETNLWNGGICSECGGKWIYDRAVGHRCGTSYLYVCEKCERGIETFQRFPAR